MTFRSVLIISLFIFWGCATNKPSYEEIRDDQIDFIEVNVGSTIFGSKASRALLTTDGKLIKEKRNVFGSWKIKPVQIESSLTDSLFAIAASQHFKSLPQNLDQNCTVSYKDQDQKKKSIAVTKTDQPTKSIRFQNSTHSKTIVWKKCSALTESQIERIKTEVNSEEEIQSVLNQNEQISMTLAELNSLFNTMFSLNN